MSSQCLCCELTLNLICTSHHNNEVCTSHHIFWCDYCYISDSYLIWWGLRTFRLTVQQLFLHGSQCLSAHASGLCQVSITARGLKILHLYALVVWSKSGPQFGLVCHKPIHNSYPLLWPHMCIQKCSHSNG